MKLLFDQFDELIIEFDSDFNFVSWNKKAKTAFSAIGILQGEKLLSYLKDPLLKELKANPVSSKKFVFTNKGKTVSFTGKSIVSKKESAVFLVLKKTEEKDLNNVNEDTLESVLTKIDIVFYRVRVEENGKKNLYFVSNNASDVFGLSVKEYIDKMSSGEILEYFHKADYPSILSTNDTIFKKKKAAQVFYRFYNKQKKKYVWIEEKGYPLLDKGKKLTGMYGIAREVSSIIENEINLKRTANFYKNILENNLSGYYRINLDYTIIEANDAFARMFGYKSRKEVLNKKVFKLYKSSTDEQQFLQSILKKRKLINHESKVILHSNKVKFFLENASFFKDERTGDEFVEATIFDITESKETQIALQQSEEKFKRLSDSTEEGVLIHDGGIVIEVNESFCKLSGYKESEIVGNSVFKLVSEKSHQLIKERLKSFYELPYEVIGKKKNGKEFVAELVAKEIGKGKKLRVVTIRDVTEKRKTEEALRLSEEKYRNLYEENVAGVFRTNVNGHIYECNRAFLKIFGYKSKTDFLKKSSKSLYFTSKEREDYIRDLRKKRVLNNYELLTRKKDGSKIWVSVNVTLSNTAEGEIIQGTLVDITSQKLAQQELFSNIDKYRKLFENASDAILIVRNWKIIDCNEISAKLFKTTKRKLEGKSFESLIAFDLLDKKQKKEYDDVFVKKNVYKNKVYECVLKDDKKGIIYAEIAVSVITEDNENIYQLIIHDITKQVDEQNQLIRSKENFENLIEYSPDGNLIIDQNKVIYSNTAAVSILGQKNKKSILGKNILSFFVNNAQGELDKLIRLVKETKSNTRFYEYKIKSEGKKLVEVGLQLTSIQYGDLQCVNMILYDLNLKKQLAQQELRANIAEEANRKLEEEIKQHKKTQQKLSDQVAMTNALMEGSQNVLIYTLNRKFEVTSYNSIFEHLALYTLGFDIKKDKMFVKVLEKLISEEDKKIMYERFNLAFKGESVRLEGPLRSSAGSTVWIETFINPIKKEGNVVEISCISTDITEKKQKNEELKNSLKEKEILLKEVHHRVKNNLQIISSILNLQTSFSNDEKVNEILRESQNRVKSMAYLHENLYQNKNFSYINFTDYLVNLSKNLVHSYYLTDSSADLVFDVEKVDLDLDKAIPCGLIVNELLTNAVKYAFPENQRGTIHVSVKQKDDTVTLRVADNGRGLPKHFDVNKTNTLGLQLVTTLTEQLDGTLEVRNSKGAEFVLTFKKTK